MQRQVSFPLVLATPSGEHTPFPSHHQPAPGGGKSTGGERSHSDSMALAGIAVGLVSLAAGGRGSATLDGIP